MRRYLFCYFVLFLIQITLLAPLQASIVIDNTRAIYPANAKEVTLRLTNHSSTPVLVQSWLDKGDSDESPANINTPFIIMPPIFRVDGKRGQALRISLIGREKLPSDRETLYWINVLDIPPKPHAEHQITVALRSRIKLFYRPTGLAGNPTQAARQLHWRSDGSNIIATNSTPWHVSLVSIATSRAIFALDSVSPQSSRTFAAPVPPGTPVLINWIDDYGATQSYEGVVK